MNDLNDIKIDFNKFLEEKIDEAEKELVNALQILKKHNVVAIERQDGTRLSIDFLLNLKHKRNNTAQSSGKDKEMREGAL